jgi:glucan phosphoethanolaminetransferase (alkaline phosphatase superfamily)
MANRPSIFYGYMLIAFSLVIFAISLWAMMQALNYYESNEFPQFFMYGIMASVGIVLSVSSITQMRRRMVILQTIATKVLSTVVCASCGFKVVRTFSPGDYVPKEVGQCQQCKGTMRVDLIYAEEPKSKKKI